jgi:hypothetical protein
MNRPTRPLTSLLLPLLIIILFSRICDARNRFEDCKIDVEKILNGTHPKHVLNNETILPYIYHGYVDGLDTNLKNRSDYLTLNFEGLDILAFKLLDLFTDIWQGAKSSTTYIRPSESLLLGSFPS